MRGLLLVTIVLVTGCLGPRQDPSAYFLLSPEPAPAQGVSVPAVLGLGPVTLPAYLDRPQIVVRLNENEIALAEADRWAEPLGEHFTRTLELNLSRQLPGSSYVDYPWYESQAPEFAVALDVQHFEADATGTVLLEATWRLSRAGTAMDGRATRIEASAGGLGQGAAVAAQSRALAALSAEIAAAVRLMWANR